MIENPNVICNNCGFCEQNKILEQQLNIAIEALKEYAREDWWDDAKTPEDDFNYRHPKCAWCCNGYETAQEALQKIKELNNVNTDN